MSDVCDRGVVLVRLTYSWLCAWAPACMVFCIPWWAVYYTWTDYCVGDVAWVCWCSPGFLTILILIATVLGSRYFSYWYDKHRPMWPQAKCISSIVVQTPSLQLGVLQSLRGSFQLVRSHILLAHTSGGLWSEDTTSPSPSKQPKSGIREWTP